MGRKQIFPLVLFVMLCLINYFMSEHKAEILDRRLYVSKADLRLARHPEHDLDFLILLLPPLR